MIRWILLVLISFSTLVNAAPPAPILPFIPFYLNAQGTPVPWPTPGGSSSGGGPATCLVNINSTPGGTPTIGIYQPGLYQGGSGGGIVTIGGQSITLLVQDVKDIWTPTNTPSYTITPTFTQTATPTQTPTVTMTPTVTLSPTVTWTPTDYHVWTLQDRWNMTATAANTGTYTSTFTATNTSTATPTFTQTATATATPTYTTTATSTSTPTVTATPTTNNYMQGYNSMGQPLLSGTAMSGDSVLDSRHNQVALDFSQGITSSTAVTTLTGSAEATTLHGTAYMLCFGPGASESKLTSVNTLIYRPRVDWFFSMSSAFTTVGGSGGPSYTQAGVLNTTTGEGFWFGEEASSSAAITFGITWVSLNTGSPVTTFVPQSAWNGDTCLGQANSKFTSMGSPVALNPANLNVYDVRALWLGAGVVQFRIYSPDNTFVVVHTIAYPNSNTAPYITAATGLGLYIDANKGYTTASPSQIMYVSCMTLGTLSKERAMLDYWNDNTLADASESAIVGRLLSGDYAPIGATNASGVTAMDVVVVPTNTSTPNSFTPTPTGSATPTFTSTPTYTLTPAAGAFLMDAAGNTLSSTGHALNVDDVAGNQSWAGYLASQGLNPQGTPYTKTFTPTVTVTGSATPTFTTTSTPTGTPTAHIRFQAWQFQITPSAGNYTGQPITLNGIYEYSMADLGSSGISGSVSFSLNGYIPGTTFAYALIAPTALGTKGVVAAPGIPTSIIYYSFYGTATPNSTAAFLYGCSWTLAQQYSWMTPVYSQEIAWDRYYRGKNYCCRING